MFITASWCNSVHQNLAEDYKNGGIGTGRKVVAPSLSSLVTSFRFNFIIFIIMILWMWWREQDLNGKVSQKKMLNWWMMMKWCFYYEVSHFLRNFSFPRSTFDPSSLLWIKRWSEWNPKVSHYFCNLNGNMSERMREWQELHSFSFLLASRNGKERERKERHRRKERERESESLFRFCVQQIELLERQRLLVRLIQIKTKLFSLTFSTNFFQWHELQLDLQVNYFLSGSNYWLRNWRIFSFFIFAQGKERNSWHWIKDTVHFSRSIHFETNWYCYEEWERSCSQSEIGEERKKERE